jgi:hypothetical protein
MVLIGFKRVLIGFNRVLAGKGSGNIERLLGKQITAQKSAKKRNGP